MMIGLDLFSGIGGLTIGLKDYVRPIAYCENEPYAQCVLMSRMHGNLLPVAPIWNDVRTLRGNMFPEKCIDIIYGGFPCQDISVAGARKGLEGERSGLFFEVVRLAAEIKPTFIFLENVRGILSKGIDTVLKEMAEIGYDCRYTILSAADVGAWHRRERWWLLAYANSGRKLQSQGLEQEKRGWVGNLCSDVSYTSSHSLRSQQELQRWGFNQDEPRANGKDRELANTEHVGSHGSQATSSIAETICNDTERTISSIESEGGDSSRMLSSGAGVRSQNPWSVEPDVDRVVNGLPYRVDRIKCLGNSVVPQCAKEAFKELMGL